MCHDTSVILYCIFLQWHKFSYMQIRIEIEYYEHKTVIIHVLQSNSHRNSFNFIITTVPLYAYFVRETRN